MLRRTLDTTRTRYHSGMILSVLDLTVLKRIYVGYMVFTLIHLFGNSPKHSHSQFVLLTCCPPCWLCWPSIAPKDLEHQSWALCPLCAGWEVQGHHFNRISSIHQEKPTEHFVMYKEILVQPFSWQTFGWSNENILAVAEGTVHFG